MSLPHNSFSFSCFLMFHYFSVSVPVLGQSPDSNNPVSRLSLVLGQREVMRGPRAHGTNCGIRSSARWPDLSLALIIDLSGQEMFTDLLLCNIFWYRISLVYQGRLPGADITHWQNLLDTLSIDSSYQELCKVHFSLSITSDIRKTNVSNQLITVFTL